MRKFAHNVLGTPKEDEGMLRSIHEMQGYTIQATDGEIGKVVEFLFDDEHWVVRYMVVDTGGWLSGRRVLISPIAIQAARWDQQTIDVDLARQQVEQNPGIETDKPVSRQREIEYAGYYGYAPYWGSVGVWGAGMYPAAMYPVTAPMAPVAATPVTAPPATPSDGTPGGVQTTGVTATPVTAPSTTPARQEGDPHLRSTREVIGYAIQASDDEIGHVDDFMVDDETWELRYIVVDTSNWLAGKKVLVTPRQISQVSWAESRVYVALSRDTIEGAPPFDPYTPTDRKDEVRLQQYYQQSVH
jgi:uncharacterized protein YrrD